MALKASILAVDDQEFNQIMLISLLEDEYDISCVNDGLECIKSIEKQKPDLVLMDVKMPEIDGLEACRRLRKDHDNIDLPILFVSGMTSDNDRLEGYKAGGDDYITKPYNEKELLSKIKVILESSIQSRQSRDSVNESQKVALASMANSYEIGTILSFIKNSFTCIDFNSLHHELDICLKAFGFECGALFKQLDGNVFFSSDNAVRPLEEVALRKVNESGQRIVEFGQKIFFSDSMATILVRKMPLDDVELAGRLKDHMTILIQALNSRINGINTETQHLHREQNLSKTIDLTKNSLRKIEDEQREQQLGISSIISNIGIQMEDLFFTLNLEDSQERAIENLLTEAEVEGDKLFNQGVGIETRFEIIIAALENT